jgi:hypothetical protein
MILITAQMNSKLLVCMINVASLKTEEVGTAGFIGRAIVGLTRFSKPQDATDKNERLKVDFSWYACRR